MNQQAEQTKHTDTNPEPDNVCVNTYEMSFEMAGNYFMNRARTVWMSRAGNVPNIEHS